MEEYHSTKGLIIDRSLGGERVRIPQVSGALTKDGNMTVFVFKDGVHSDGDVWRQFFTMLDNGELKSQQGAVLHNDKKNGWYLDKSTSFPKGLMFDPQNSHDDKICFKFKTYNYKNGISRSEKLVYRTLVFSKSVFSDDLDTPHKMAWYLKNHLNETVSIGGMRIYEYLTDQFDKVPAVYVPQSNGIPTGIKILNVSTEKAQVACSIVIGGLPFKTTVDMGRDIPMNLHRSLYVFYIAHLLSNGGITTKDGRFVYDPKTSEYKRVVSYSGSSDVKSETSNVSKIIADPNSEAASALIGKKVIGSNAFSMVDTYAGILKSIDVSSDCPFVVAVASAGQCEDMHLTFIKEAPRPKLVCYDFSKPEVRSALYGKIYRMGEEEEGVVCSFVKRDDRWLLNGKMTSYKFMTDCIWVDDQSPCASEEKPDD